MANPAEQTRQRAQSKWPGATVAERGRGYLKHQHPSDPARFMLDTQTGGKWHYGDPPFDQAQEIDTAWQPTAGAWQYEMTTNDWQTYARDTFNVGNIFEFHKNGEWVSFDPQSINWIDENTSRQQIAIKQAVAAQVDDDRLLFPGAYGTGIDFEYQNQTARLKKIISIDSFARIDTTLPAGNTIWFEAEFTISHSSGVEVYVDGALWQKANNVRVQTADRIEFRDAATGSQVFWWLDFPRAWDSAGDEVIGQMEVRRDGGPSSLFITVRIPKAWIDSAVFPVYIDPTIDEQVGASADDAHEGETDFAFSSTDTNLLCQAAANNFDRFWAGARFAGVAIANGVTIDTGTNTELYSTDTDELRCDVHANDVDDADDFSTTADVSGRTLTTASVSWVDTTTGANTWMTSPDIDAVIQEIVDRPGWASGQDMCLIYKAQSHTSTEGKHFRAYDGGSTLAPKLHIEYTAAGTPLSRTKGNLSQWKQGVKIVG